MLIINGNSINEIEVSEKTIQKNILDNFDKIFPNYKILKSEFKLSGDVRKFGISGRIDIFAYNKLTFSLVIIELKKKNDKNILFQIIDYSDFVTENIFSIINDLNIDEQTKLKILKAKKLPEIVLIASEFNHPTIRRILNIKNEVKILKYKYFENGIVYLEDFDEKKPNKLEKKINIENGKIKDEDFDKMLSKIIEFMDEQYFERDYNNIVVNPTLFYKGYRQMTQELNIPIISKTDFINNLKKSKFFVNSKKSCRFKDKITSVFYLQIL